MSVTNTPPSLREDLLSIVARPSSRPLPGTEQSKAELLPDAPTRMYLGAIPWLEAPRFEQALPTRLLLTQAGRYRAR
jgi:hypothetical protein